MTIDASHAAVPNVPDSQHEHVSQDHVHSSRLAEDKAIDEMWSFYLRKAERIDKEMTESWKGDTDGILIFTGLFSATVAAFIVDNYKSLQPDTGAATVALLVQISAQLNGTGTVGAAVSPVSLSDALSQPSTPVGPYLRVNILWVLSLCLSISCALSAILVQQWARHYLRLSQRRQDIPGLQARIHAYLTKGISKSGIQKFVEAIPSILQVSVFLFFVGLVELYFTINTVVAYAVLAFLIVFAAVFLLLTVMPIVFRFSPYNTPLTSPLWWIVSKLSYVVLNAMRTVRAVVYCTPKLRETSSGSHYSLKQLWLEAWDYSYFQSPLRRFFMPRTLDIERSVLVAPWSRIECDSLVWTLVGFDLSNASIGKLLRGLHVMLRRQATRFVSGEISYVPLAQFLLSESPVRTALKRLCEKPGPEADNGVRVCMDLVWEFANCFPTPSFEAVEIFPLPPTDEKRIELMTALTQLISDVSDRSGEDDGAVGGGGGGGGGGGTPTAVWLALELGDLRPTGELLSQTIVFYTLPRHLRDRYCIKNNFNRWRRDRFLLNIVGLIADVLPHVKVSEEGLTSVYLLNGVLLRLLHWESYHQRKYPLNPSSVLLEELERQRLHALSMTLGGDAAMPTGLPLMRKSKRAIGLAISRQHVYLAGLILRIQKWVESQRWSTCTIVTQPDKHWSFADSPFNHPLPTPGGDE